MASLGGEVAAKIRLEWLQEVQEERNQRNEYKNAFKNFSCKKKKGGGGKERNGKGESGQQHVVSLTWKKSQHVCRLIQKRRKQ